MFSHPKATEMVDFSWKVDLGGEFWNMSMYLDGLVNSFGTVDGSKILHWQQFC